MSSDRDGSLATEANTLLDLWSSVSARHISLGTACACGVGGVTLQLNDFEQDIVDFVVGQAERMDRQDVLSFLETRAREDEWSKWRMALLLNALRTDESRACTDDVAKFILERLRRTMQSFVSQHG